MFGLHDVSTRMTVCLAYMTYLPGGPYVLVTWRIYQEDDMFGLHDVSIRRTICSLYMTYLPGGLYIWVT